MATSSVKTDFPGPSKPLQGFLIGRPAAGNGSCFGLQDQRRSGAPCPSYGQHIISSSVAEPNIRDVSLFYFFGAARIFPMLGSDTEVFPLHFDYMCLLGVMEM